MQQSSAAAGLELANWYWRAVRQFVLDSFGISLSRSSCLNYLHRLGFSCKRPKKRLLKANESKRKALPCGVCRPWKGGPTDRSQGILCRRGPLPGRRRVAGQVGARRRTGNGGLDQSQVRGEGQLLLGGVPGDWGGGVDGTWRATATPGPRLPSWSSCGGGTAAGRT